MSRGISEKSDHQKVVEYENDRVLAVKRKAQAAKGKAVEKRATTEGASHRLKKKKTAPLSLALSDSEADGSNRSGFGTHHSASPLNTIIPNEFELATEGDGLILESANRVEKDTSHNLDNDTHNVRDEIAHTHAYGSTGHGVSSSSGGSHRQAFLRRNPSGDELGDPRDKDEWFGSDKKAKRWVYQVCPYEWRLGYISPGVDGPRVMPEAPYAYVALPPPDYVPGPEEPEQAPPSPVYIPYVPEPIYPEYIPPEDDIFPAEEQPLPAAASPTAESPGYIPESDPDEDPEEDDDKDPEEDLADYPADHDDEEEEEPSGDDADEEDEEQDEDDDEEEEEHPASADSILPPPALRDTARISFRPQPLTLSFTKEDAERFLAMSIPPPSPLTPLSSPLP
nr:hypothetical protein [Tanacetum cinerariifolium]